MANKNLLSALRKPVRNKNFKLLDELFRGKHEPFSRRAEEEIKRLIKDGIQEHESSEGKNGKR